MLVCLAMLLCLAFGSFVAFTGPPCSSKGTSCCGLCSQVVRMSTQHSASCCACYVLFYQVDCGFRTRFCCACRAWDISKLGDLTAAGVRDKAHSDLVNACVWHKNFLYR